MFKAIKERLLKIFVKEGTDDFEKQSEYRANCYLSFSLLLIAGIILALYILVLATDLFDLIHVTKSIVTYLFPFLIIGLIVPFVLIFIRKKTSKHFKTICLCLLLLVVSLVYILTPRHGALVWVLPMVLVLHYYDPYASRHYFFGTVGCLLICTYLGMIFGQWDNNIIFERSFYMSLVDEDTLDNRIRFLNYLNSGLAPDNRVLKAYLFYALPNIVILATIFFSCMLLSKRTRKMSDDHVNKAAEGARIESELNIAAQIQNNALPTDFPNNDKIDVYGVMIPAKEVGGDFYDFSFKEQNKLLFNVSDVSGKGVPAAMYMMKSKALLGSIMDIHASIEEGASNINNKLAADNDMMMFVTSWLGSMNMDNGLVQYINAGHNPPLLIKKDGTISFIRNKSGNLFGIVPGAKYHKYEFKLEEGDQLVLYTDGITEAKNTADHLYGEDRLEHICSKYQGMSSKERAKSIVQDVYNFADGAEQSDDATLLILTFKEKPTELTVKSDIKNGREIMKFVENHLSKHNTANNIKSKIYVAIDEIFSNICKYGYKNSNGNITVRISVTDNTMRLTLIDSAPKFNPLEVEAADLYEDFENRKIGGLGIYLTKQTMDDVIYEYKDNKNHVTLVKKF